MCFDRGSRTWRKADPAVSSTSDQFGRLWYCTFDSKVSVTDILTRISSCMRLTFNDVHAIICRISNVV